MKPYNLQELSRIYDMIAQASFDMQNYWLHNVLFHWRWWLSLGLTIVPWIIWILLRKKPSTARLMFAGATVMVLSSLLETIGVSRGYWWYGPKSIPIPTTNLMWSYSLMPVTIMFVLQYKPHIKPLIKAVLYSAVACYVGMPIFSFLSLYVQKHWSLFYSFVITIVIYLVADFVAKRSTFAKL